MEQVTSEMETQMGTGTVSERKVTGLDPEVSAYVGLVRIALRDLPVEDIEDLTGGLEADLAELAAESEEPLIARLGEPSGYAAELRMAAGLPPADPAAVAPAESWWHRDRRVLRERWTRARADHPWLEKLRPVWWLLRGAVLIWTLLSLAGGRSGLLLLTLGAGLSFWVGLRQDGWDGWPRRLVLWANLLAALLFLPFLADTRFGGGGIASSETLEVVPGVGVFVDGNEPAGFYVYDGEGQRVEGARIFTDLGVAVAVEPWLFDDGTGTGASGPVDTFPVDAGDLDGWNGWTPDSGMREWTPPTAIPPAFPTAATTPSAEPTPTASVTETAEATTTPGATMSPEATTTPEVTATP